MKKLAPNCAAPMGFPQGRTPFCNELAPFKCLHADEGHTHSAAVASIRAVRFRAITAIGELTAMAMVPLLLISTKVMMAIRISGISLPPIVNSKHFTRGSATARGDGHAYRHVAG